MRIVTVAKLALLGGAIGAVVVGVRRSRERAITDADIIPPIDPDDPVQAIGEVPPLGLDELDVDARTLSDVELPVDPALLDTDDATIERFARDAGDLYGVHVPRAVDRDLPDDDRAQDEGENWLEALAARAGENGPEPEHVLDVVDEDDLDSPPSDTRDRPVADRGSGGIRGM